MTLIAFILAFALFFLYAIVIYRLSSETIKSVNSILPIRARISYYLAFSIPGVILFFLLQNEQFVYFWDYSGYWYKAIAFSDSFFNQPFSALKSVRSSINHEEYNSLPNVIPVLFNKTLGLNFNSYVLSTYIVYGIPFSLIFSSLIIKLNPQMEKWLKLCIPFTILCFTPCLIPIRYGFIDMVGLVYIGAVLLLWVRNDYFARFNLKAAILTGLLLLLLIFNRRWYAFWFVAFYIAAFIPNAIIAIKDKNKILIINTIKNLFIAGAVPTIVMLLFFYRFFAMTVLKDYKDIYSAYRGADILHQANNFKIFFGLFILVISFLGLVLCIKKLNRMLLFFIISSTLITFLFIRVNDFGGLQHYYLLIPFFLFFFLQAMAYFPAKKITAPVVFILLIINNVYVFGINGPGQKNLAFSDIEAKAFYRPDYAEIEKISNTVIKLIEEGNSVYCLASAGVLNEDVIKHIKLPDIYNPVFKLLRTQHVDKRDHFPIELFTSNYVITTLPAELHLGAENQKIIAYFNDAIMNGNLKNHYKKVSEFKLKDNVTAYLMQKVSGLNNNEIDTILNYFKNAYPDYEQMYTANRSIMRTTSIISGDGYGTALFQNENTLHLVPGNNRPSTVSFTPGSNEKTLTFTATFNDKENLVKSCDPNTAGEVYLSIIADGHLIEKKYLTYKKDENITIDISLKKKITLTVNKGKNEDYCDWFKITNLQIK